MAEIGVTLREARMRAGIDIAEVESRTKIRAKYLRALENEEWSLLPGTTFVKSFLRTYAEALGLDAKLLVEEYKFRHEPYESGGIGVAPRRQADGGRRGRRGRRGGGGAFGPPKRTNWLPIIVLLLLIAVALWVVYRTSKDEGEPSSPAATPTTTKAESPSRTRPSSTTTPTLVRMRVTGGGSAAVYVCVVDASGKKVVNGRQLQPGKRTAVLRSKSFRIALSSSKAKVTRGGKRLSLKADSRGVVAYRITPDSETRLPANQRPSCR